MKFIALIISIAILTACSSTPDRDRSRDIVFEAHGMEFLRFAPQGYVFVKGQAVQSKENIWVGFLTWWNIIKTEEYKQFLVMKKTRATPPPNPDMGKKGK